jgi:hypothetical protein
MKGCALWGVDGLSDQRHNGSQQVITTQMIKGQHSRCRRSAQTNACLKIPCVSSPIKETLLLENFWLLTLAPFRDGS